MKVKRIKLWSLTTTTFYGYRNTIIIYIVTIIKDSKLKFKNLLKANFGDEHIHIALLDHDKAEN